MQNNHDEFAKKRNLKSHTRKNEKRTSRPETDQELTSGFYLKSQQIYTSISNEATTSQTSTNITENESNDGTSWTKKKYSSYTEIARTSQQKRRRIISYLMQY